MGTLGKKREKILQSRAACVMKRSSSRARHSVALQTPPQERGTATEDKGACQVGPILEPPNPVPSRLVALRHGATTRSPGCEMESVANRLGTPRSPLVYRLGGKGRGGVYSSLELEQVLPAGHAAQPHDHPDSEQQEV